MELSNKTKKYAFIFVVFHSSHWLYTTDCTNDDMHCAVLVKLTLVHSVTMEDESCIMKFIEIVPLTSSTTDNTELNHLSSPLLIKVCLYFALVFAACMHLSFDRVMS